MHCFKAKSLLTQQKKYNIAIHRLFCLQEHNLKEFTAMYERCMKECERLSLYALSTKARECPTEANRSKLAADSDKFKPKNEHSLGATNQKICVLVSEVLSKLHTVLNTKTLRYIVYINSTQFESIHCLSLHCSQYYDMQLYSIHFLELRLPHLR